MRSLKNQGGWLQYVGAALSAYDALSNMGKSNSASNSQKNLLNQQAATAEDMNGVSQDQYDLYNNYSGDVYDGIFNEINKGPDYAGAMGVYTGDVNQAFDSMQGEAERNNFRYGVNPSSGRFEETQRRNGVDKSLAKVNAQNTARREEDDKHWARMLTGANTVQGFMNNSVNAANSSMGGNASAAGGYGNMANMYQSSANDGMQAAGYLSSINPSSGSNNGVNNVEPTNYNNGINTTGYSYDENYGML